MAHDNLAEHITKIGRHCQVSAFVAALHGQAGPSSIHRAATHAAADDDHRVAVAVIGAAVAVLAHGPAEFGHGQNNGVFQSVPKVGDESCDTSREVVQT